MKAFAILFLLAASFQAAQAQWDSVSTGRLHDVNMLFADSGMIYAACGTRFFQISDSGGIYGSADGGKTWTLDSTGMGLPGIQTMAKAGNALYAVGDSLLVTGATWGGGVFRSTNKGASWSRILSKNLNSLAIAGDTIFATHDQETNLYRSTNDGASWDALPLNIDGGMMPLTHANAGLFGLGGIDGSSGTSVYRSSDGGVNWTKSISSFNQYWIGQTVLGNGNYIYNCYNDTGISISSDGGKTWLTYHQLPGDTGHMNSLTVINGVLFAQYRDGGLALSTNNGASWKNISDGLPLLNGVGIFPVHGIALYSNYLIVTVENLVTGNTDIWKRKFSDLVSSSVKEFDPQSVQPSLFPNPVSSILNIAGPQLYIKATVIDLMGRGLLSPKINSSGWIDVHDLPSGRYEIILQSPDGIAVSQFSVVH